MSAQPLKLISWNVNGLRAILKKPDFMNFIVSQNPDIICLQETKMQPGQAEIHIPGYQQFWCSAERKGYSGVLTLVKENRAGGAGGRANKKLVFGTIASPRASIDDEPRNDGREEELVPKTNFLSHFDFSDSYGTPSTEGRLLTLDLGDFYLVNTYVPNSKPDLSRLQLRYHDWDPALCSYLKDLEKTKPVIVCGDFNAAHTEIDIARPKENEFSAGFTREERTGITNLLNQGLIDTFRQLHPEKIQYSWWSMRGGARFRNIGWRIDYFFISQSLLPRLKSAAIHDEIMGSDHAPISIEMEF